MSENLKKVKLDKDKIPISRGTKIKIAIIIFIILLIFSTIFSLINIGNNKIHHNIEISKINMSGKQTEEAQEELNKKIREKELSKITLKETEQNYETTISFEQLNISRNISKAIQEAYGVGRNSNIIINNYNILSTYMLKRNIEIETSIKEESIDNIINEIESKLPNVKTESTYSIEGNTLLIKKGKKGVVIKKEELKNKIIETIKDLQDTQNTIEIPLEEKEPEPINLDRIINEIKKEAKDAYITEEPLKVHAEENGIDLDITEDEAKKMLEENKEEYEIPLKITEPQITVASLGEKAFTDKLSTFTTNYDASNINRNNNLVLAAEKLNDTIVNPGETFSYNQTIGERTISAGFKKANAYAGGNVVLDVGGGICQLSSTLYNAALLADVNIVERHNHSFKTSYLDAGRDATVSWGALDFKFENNRNYPIKIKATAGEGIVTVEFYGIKEEKDQTVLIESKVTNIIKQKVEYKKDTTLKPGEEIIERAGEDGCTSETYKTTLKNGVITSKTLISQDTYNQLSKIIRKN